MRQEDGLIPPVALRAHDVEPLYVQLFHGLRSSIASGRIPPGTRLPSTRVLARDMEVSRNTTVLAYRQLKLEGYVRSGVGSGTYVSDEVPESLTTARPPMTSLVDAPASERSLSERGEAIVDKVAALGGGRAAMPFLPGIPAFDEFPYEIWRRIERDVRIPRRELGPGHPAGHPRLRQAIVDHLSVTRAIRCGVHQVVITTGGQESLCILAELLLDPGDRVLMEDPGYRTARRTLEKVRAEVESVPVDEGGMNVEAGLALCADARLAYVTPSNQFPLGTRLTMERRKRLVKWARATGAWIIEDDRDCEYRFHGVPYAAIRSIKGAEECTIYVNTFGKILFPALALGFIVLPEELVEAFQMVRAQRVHGPAIHPQLTLARFMEQGHLLRHIRRIRRVCLGRAEALCRALGDALPRPLRVTPPMAGSHLVAWMRTGTDDHAVARLAAAEGIVARPVSSFRRTPSHRSGLVLGFGGTPASQIPSAVHKLKRAFVRS